MEALLWALVVVAAWFVIDQIGNVANNPDWKTHRLNISTTGDTPVADSKGLSKVHTAGKMHIATRFNLGEEPLHLRALIRGVNAVNLMRSQTPYVGAVMVLTLWINNIWYMPS